MDKKQTELLKLTCLRCGKVWVPRIPDVAQCPRCHSARWDQPKKVMETVKN